MRRLGSQANQVPSHQTHSSMSLWTLLCALVRSHVGTGRGHLQTVPTKLGERNCPTCLGMLKHLELSPTPEKQPNTITLPPPNYTLGTTATTNRKTQTRPSDCQTEKCDSSLQRTRLHCSRVQWQHALHHCIRRFALYLVM